MSFAFIPTKKACENRGTQKWKKLKDKRCWVQTLNCTNWLYKSPTSQVEFYLLLYFSQSTLVTRPFIFPWQQLGSIEQSSCLEKLKFDFKKKQKYKAVFEAFFSNWKMLLVSRVWTLQAWSIKTYVVKLQTFSVVFESLIVIIWVSLFLFWINQEKLVRF